jgi:hypothetical protein
MKWRVNKKNLSENKLGSSEEECWFHNLKIPGSILNKVLELLMMVWFWTHQLCCKLMILKNESSS